MTVARETFWRVYSAVWRRWRAGRIVRAARAPRVNMGVVAATWRYRARMAVQNAAYALGEGIGAGYDAPGRQRLEERVAAAEADARVYESQWRLTNEDLRRARVCQRQAEKHALELLRERDLARVAVDVRGFTERARKWWWR